MDEWRGPSGHVFVALVRDVAVITLARPEKLNAMSASMRVDLATAIRRFGDGTRARGIVVVGSGRAFCSGEDLTGLVAEAAEDVGRSIDLFHDLTRAVLESEVPAVAAINGFAIGGGCELTLCFDARIGSPGAVFRLPENNLGIPISNGASALLFRLLRGSDAVRLVLDARWVDAREALALGLLDEIVSGAHDDLVARALDLVSSWTEPGKATREHLRLLRPSIEEIEAAMERETLAARAAWTSGTMRDGTKRFADRKTSNLTPVDAAGDHA